VRALLDTCVLAEARNPKGSAAVKAALGRVDDGDLFVSALTVGEIAKGVALLSVGKKKRELTAWLGGLEALFADRILPVDREIAVVWGEITARASKKGVVVPAIDGLLAATALKHGMHLWTRNTRHFEATGVLLVDPWKGEAT
jgi:predicted nucleic acid-binding protein